MSNDPNQKFDLGCQLYDIPLLGRQYIPKFWKVIEPEELNQELAISKNYEAETSRNNQPSTSLEEKDKFSRCSEITCYTRKSGISIDYKRSLSKSKIEKEYSTVAHEPSIKQRRVSN